MRLFRFALLSFTVIVVLSGAYAVFLHLLIAWSALNFAAWLFFTLIEGFFVLSIAGAYYFFPIRPDPPAPPYEMFKSGIESPDLITEELEIPEWMRK